MTSSREQRRIDVAALGSGVIRSTAESTRGGGSNASGGTSSSGSIAVAPLQHHRQPAVVLAARRRGHAVDDFLLQHEVLVDDGVGRLEQVEQDRRRDVVRQVADDAQLAPAAAAAQRREVDLSTSASITSSPGVRRSRAARSRSSSIDGERARSARAADRSARRSPGPISTSASPGRGSIASTIPSITAPSIRKCWPKRLRRAARLGTAHARRSRAPSSLRRLAHLDVGAAAQVAQPLRRTPPRTSARAACCAPARAAAGGRASSGAGRRPGSGAAPKRDITGSEMPPTGSAVHRLLELGHEGAGRGPAEVAALRRAAVLGVLARQLLEGPRARRRCRA